MQTTPAGTTLCQHRGNTKHREKGPAANQRPQATIPKDPHDVQSCKKTSTDDSDVWPINVCHNRISPPPLTTDETRSTFRNQHVANYGARLYSYLYGH
ncbi:hypothetical protein Hanom_Chr06g00570981 [Helianthus anomalus]